MSFNGRSNWGSKAGESMTYDSDTNFRKYAHMHTSRVQVLPSGIKLNGSISVLLRPDDEILGWLPYEAPVYSLVFHIRCRRRY